MPGYLFVQMPYGPLSWYTLRAGNGVKGVLGVANSIGELEPFPISSRLVERIMAAQLNLKFDDTREAMAGRGRWRRPATELVPTTW
jgi:transcription antitermination factor NusG